ncbi:GrdX family protein [Niallia sp. XMNu-256]|uniref:GrdX family protein n=1 Tax=Niallia sp. XMNu-256 TaxID=3082444 RepID=UPI0030CE405B
MIVTNNKRVAENYQDAILIDGDIHDLYQKVRDFVYIGHKLHTHPLSASIGMLHSPVKSVILSDTIHFDQKSMKIISESIQKYKNLIGKRQPKVSRQSDYELLDFELTSTALEELKKFRRG